MGQTDLKKAAPAIASNLIHQDTNRFETSKYRNMSLLLYQQLLLTLKNVMAFYNNNKTGMS